MVLEQQWDLAEILQGFGRSGRIHAKSSAAAKPGRVVRRHVINMNRMLSSETLNPRWFLITARCDRQPLHGADWSDYKAVLVLNWVSFWLSAAARITGEIRRSRTAGGLFKSEWSIPDSI